MRLTDAQYERVAPLLSLPRGKLTVPQRQVLDALCLDSTIIKLHADGVGALRNRDARRPDPRAGARAGLSSGGHADQLPQSFLALRPRPLAPQRGRTLLLPAQTLPPDATRYDKLDVVFPSFVHLAMTWDALQLL